MSEIKIASTNYTDNNFLAAKKNADGSYNVEGKVVFEKDITTPAGDFATKADLASKQDKLTASTGINLNGSTISVNTASTVGTSNLPVTSAAVNTKLNDYATTTQLDNKQDDVGLSIGDDGNLMIEKGMTQSGMIYENYFEAPTQFGGSVEFQGDIKIGNQHPVLDVTSSDDSVTVTRSADGYGVDLKANGGSIDENRVITGRYETFGYDANRFIADSKINAIRLGRSDINTNVEEGRINVHVEESSVNADFTIQTSIGAFTPSATISIPCDDYNGYTAIMSNRGTEVMRFEHDTSAGYDTHNTKICFNAPVYDKEGNEITGGGGGGSDRVTTDADGRTLILGNNSSENYGGLVIGTQGEIEGDLGSPMIYATGDAPLYIGCTYSDYGTKGNFISFCRSYGDEDFVIRIKIGEEELILNQAKLQKLKELLES